MGAVPGSVFLCPESGTRHSPGRSFKQKRRAAESCQHGDWGAATGVLGPQKGPQPGSEDALSKEELLRPLEIPNPRTDHNLRRLLRRATGPRFLAVYLAVLVLVIMALGVYIAGLKSSQCPDPQIHATDDSSRAENVKNSEVLAPCGEGWIWFRNKCYFFSEKEANWDDAEHACDSFNSSLAVIDNQREMDFVMRYKGEIDHWIGLRRDSGQPWKWVNGTEFNNWFTIKDYSDCAFLNHPVRSSECDSKHHWICTTTKAHSDARKRKRSSWTGPHFH